MSRRIIPVSTLVHYLKGSLESDPVLHGVLVQGEISNLRKPYSGHWYFSLKDEKSSISCVMFSSYNRRITFPVNNGDKVELKGDVSVYEAGGSLQIMVTAMRPAGIGDLYLKLEEMKKRLQEEGLFDAAHKKKLPSYPMDVALVTGNNTAAREDVLITLQKRWPCASLHEYPAPVQGMDAAPKIIEALRRADEGGHDVILLVRGGGSIEDLWCFNDEALARFIYQMNTPVVTGIGHEIDFTLCDYTADVRANTPTGAVETAVPDRNEVSAMLHQYAMRMHHQIQSRMDGARIHLDHLSTCPVLSDPSRITDTQRMLLQHYSAKLMHFPLMIHKDQMHLMQLQQRFHMIASSRMMDLRKQIENKQQALNLSQIKMLDDHKDSIRKQKETIMEQMHLRLQQINDRMSLQSALLDAYSPLKILARGYSVMTKDTVPVKDSTVLKKGDIVSIRLSKGSVEAEITEVIHGTENEI